ncbi:MAG: DUF2318 domain-containing protein [Ruminococcus sp.]|nr:DUF2318 domain-containing protein [Ruminococcus sp.]
MLKFFEQLTLDLMITSVIVGMLYAFVRCKLGKTCGIIFLSGGGFAVASSVFVAILKNTNRDLKLPFWNSFTYVLLSILVIASLVLILLTVLWLAVRRWRRLSRYPVTAAAVVVTFTAVVNGLPNVLAYPFNFDLQGNSVFSTDFLYRLIGLLLGFALVLVMCIAAYKTVKKASDALSVIFIDLAVFVGAFSVLGRWLQLMLQLQIIRQNRDRDLFKLVFPILQFVNNHQDLFIFGAMACVALLAVIQFVRNLHVRGEYDNPAQKRKLRAAMRNIRRWACVVLACAILGTVNLTVVHAINNKKPVEAPVEQCEMDNDNLYVDFSQVDDGHLHRFAYNTDKGVEIRFIVIKKPNSSSYGVGLDACDICGEAGYFEREGQIVCKRCDVVMNINTIGFKGGCNPIVIDYEVKDGRIIVPIEGLVLHERKFK